MDTSNITIDILKERILPKIKRADSGCWEWTGNITPGGYAHWTLGHRGEQWRVHKLMYQLVSGEVLPRTKKAIIVIDHICNNKKCVNPKHLQKISQKENINRVPGREGNYIRYCNYEHEPEIRITQKRVYYKGKWTGRINEVRSCAICCREYWREKRASK